MRRRTSRTVITVLAAAAMFVTVAAPAFAKKPTAEPVQVTITYEGAGIATNCDEPHLLMVPGRNGFLRADWSSANTDVELNIPIPWERNHPVPAAGESLTGCHGSALPGSAEGNFEGYFILESASDGSVVLTSRFDYFWAFDVVQQGKKFREVQTVLEFFEINATLQRETGQPFDWSATGVGQTVTGDLELRWFEKTVEDGAIWTTFGTTPVTMTITISE